MRIRTFTQLAGIEGHSGALEFRLQRHVQYLAMVGGLPVAARVGVFSWLMFCGLLACVGGLTLLACACAFDSFLL